jgi:hypothetical protein
VCANTQIQHILFTVWKLTAFTLKELETMKAAQKLLGGLTIGGGSALAGIVVEGVQGGK